MENKDTTYDKIELRSEKIRQLIGDIPQSLVWWGIVIVTIGFIILIAAVCLLPYPYSNGETILQHLIR